MKIISNKTQLIYDFEPRKNGENYSQCPECSKTRKHKNKKSFSWNDTKKVGYCFNSDCEASFHEYKPEREKKQYEAPKWKNKTSLSDIYVKWFEGRMISQKTLLKMGVCSDMVYMPQIQKEVDAVCFPFYLDEKLINIKSRDIDKHFALSKNAELIFYNINSLKNAKEIIITEGEIDCLSFIECGFDNCVSVPNGASSRNMEYLDNYFDLFDKLERVYLATDNDIAGIGLREELVRRLGQERCLIVNFKDCKDANEYLCKKGGLSLANTIKDAIEIPVEGIINLNSCYDDIYTLFVKGMEKGNSIEFECFDSLMTFELSRLAVITGIPGHGKSEFVDYLAIKLNILYGWKIAYFSPENYPMKYHYSKLCSKITGKKFQLGYISEKEYIETYNYIDDNVSFIYPEDDMTVENILNKAKYLVKKRGIKILVIDPYNKVEHLRNKNESETEYISRFLDLLTTFCKKYNVIIFLVAHPRKMDRIGTAYNIPTLYDINGSANFYNKCDYGIIVHRDFVDKKTIINVQKVKFKHLGDGGQVELVYNYVNGRYEKEGSSVDQWDNSNYLHHKAIEKEHEQTFEELVKDIPF
jgi:twinkle protein